MARRRDAKDLKKREKQQHPLQETSPLEISGTGPTYELLKFVLDTAGKNIRVRLPSPIPAASHIVVASKELWKQATDHIPITQGMIASAYTVSVALGQEDNIILLNKYYWAHAMKSAGENWKNSVLIFEMEFVLFHELIHLFGVKHGKPMCRKVVAYINLIEKKTLRLVKEEYIHSLREYFEGCRISERAYHSYGEGNPTLEEQDDYQRKEKEAFTKKGIKLWREEPGGDS